jgi:hypothetical protein
MKLIYRKSIKIVLTRYLVFLLLLCTTGITSLFSQDREREKENSNEKNFSEELYVKTDRDLYIAGEKVFLKIYKFNGLNHMPENMSKVVYVDLLDIYNNPVEQLKIGIDGKSGPAVLRLPDTLSTGNYIIRSYSNWMKNFSKDLFSCKKISVINPFENISDIKIPSRNSITDSVIFFPEGGQLINGIETVVGFRSIRKNGEPVIMRGILVYENNDTICRVNTETNGYGWARINPSAGKKIFLVPENKQGPLKKFSLPEIKIDGISLSRTKNDENSDSLLKIKASPAFITSDSKLHITLQSAGLPDVKKEISFRRNNEIYLSGDELPQGFLHVTIADEKENLVAERWIYNEPDHGIKYSINVQNNPFSAREKIKIGVTATDDNGTPVESDFSISVVKAFSVNNSAFSSNKYRQLPCFATLNTDNSKPEINDYLIFYKPSETEMESGLDNPDRMPVYLPELEGHLLSGNIRDKKTGEPLKNENLILSVVGKAALCRFAKTDELGNFNFVTPEHGLREIVIQPLSPEIKECITEIDNPFLSTYNNYNHELFYIDSSKLGELNKAIISTQIKNIYDPYSPKTVNKEILPEKYNFYGAPDNTILMSKYIELTSLKEVVKEIIPGVSTIRKNDKIDFKLVYKAQSQPFDNSPLVLVDGVPINDLEKVLSINSREIEKIDVLSTRYFISDVVLDGILHFISKKGNLGVMDFDKSVYRLEYELLQNNTDFYSPDYSSAALKESRIPDFRNTLYWNPDMHTDKTGITTVDFFASDESAEYIIIVEGVTPDGKSGVSRMPLIIKSK